MLQRQHSFLALFPVRPDDEFHVYRVGVANRDRSLQPAKLHLPNPAKRIRGPASNRRKLSGILFQITRCDLPAPAERRQ